MTTPLRLTIACLLLGAWCREYTKGVLTMKKLLALLCLLPGLAFGITNYVSVGSGAFSDPATWGVATYPISSNDTFTVTGGHTVYYDVDNWSVAGVGYGASVINGSLQITNQTAVVGMRMLGNLSGTGTFYIGTSALPILDNTNNQTTVTICFTTAGAITMSKTNGIAWYGERTNAVSKSWTPLAATAANGTNVLVLTDDLDLRVNDIICVSHPTAGANATYHCVSNYVAGTKTVTIGPAYTGLTTDVWPMTIAATIVTARTLGTCGVSVLKKSILCYQSTAIASTSIFTASHSGILQGVRFQKLGRGAINTVNNWTVSYCSVNNCTSYGGLAYYGTGFTFTSCTANNCSGQGGLAFNGSGNFYACSYSNLTAGRAALEYCAQSTVSRLTRSGTGADVLNYSSLYQQPQSQIIVYDAATTQAWYQAGGIASNDATASTLPYTGAPSAFKHAVTAAYQVRYFERCNLRANQTVRWNTWLRSETTSLAMLAQLTDANDDPLCAGTILSAVTNAAATNVWQKTELTYTNPNAYPMDCKLWVTANGDNAVSSGTGYSWCERGQDTQTKALK